MSSALSVRWLLAVPVVVLIACGNGPINPGSTSATDSQAEVADVSELHDITPDLPPPRPADFGVKIEANKLGGNAPLNVLFKAKITGIPADEAYVTWNFGDGTDDQVNKPDTMAWTFLSKGNYEVAVTVNWRKNLKKTKAQDKIEISVKNPASLSLDPKDPPKIHSPLVVAPGDDVTLTCTIVNEGDEIDVPFATAVYLATDPSLDQDNDGKLDDGVIQVAKVEHKGMASGIGVAATIAYTWDAAKHTGKPLVFQVPTGLEDGVPYFVVVRTDVDRVVNELDRADNEAVALDFLTQNTKAAAKSDLTITAPEFDGTAPIAPGELLPYKHEVANLGDGDAKGFKFAVFLSKDTTLTYDFNLPEVCDKDGKNCAENPKQVDKMLTSLASSNFPSLGAKVTFGLEYSLPVPEVPEGAYYLIAAVDVLDKIEEGNEANNVAVSKNTITVKKVVKQGIDLDLLAMTVKPKAIYLNGSVAIDYHVKNQGTEVVAAGFPAGIWFCQTKAFSKVNCVVNQTNFTLPEPLVAGQEYKGSKQVTINPLTPVFANWVVYLQLDPDNKFVELDEGNNLGIFEGLKIVGQPNVDLWPEVPTYHPDVVKAGTTFKVSYAVHNDGLSGSGACAIWVALAPTGDCSVAAVNTGKAFVVKDVPFSGVDGGEVVYRTDVVPAPIGLDHTLEDYQVCVIVDPKAQVPKEIKPSNNTAVSASKVKVQGAKGGCFEDPWDDAAQGKKNDTAPDAVPLSADPNVAYGSCGNEDWWKATVPKGFSLFVTMTSEAALWTVPVSPDLDIDLIAPDGKTIVDSSKLLSPFKKVAALTVPQSGEYFVRVYPHVPGAKAHYKLATTMVPPVKGIDLVGNGLAVGPGATFPGAMLKSKLKLTNLGDQASGPFVLRFVLSKDATVDAKDQTLKDFTLLSGVAGTESLDVVHTFVLPVVPGGSYWVGAVIDPANQVKEANEANNTVLSNMVQLSTEITCSGDAYSGNHTAADAAALPQKTAAYTGLNVCPGLADWFAVDVPQGKALTAKVGWKYQPGKGMVGLQIVDASKTGVLAGAANPQNTVAKLPYVQSGGLHFVHIYVLPESGPAYPYDYDLELSIADPDPSDVCLPDPYEANNSWQSAPEIGCGKASLSLCIGDEDWFKIALKKDESLPFEFNHPGNSFQLKVFGNPNLPALQVLGGNGKLTFKAPADGMYYVAVLPKAPGAKPAQGFAYTLKVDGGKGVDLTAKVKSLFPPQVVQGEDVYLTVQLSNECNDPAPKFWYGYWFSQDNKVSPDDKLLLSKEINGLAGKKQVDVDDKAIVPIDAKPGPAYVIVAADVSDTVAESQELNNSDAAPVEVVKLCLPDALEPDGAPQVATPLPLGTTKDLSLCPYDLDWHVIQLVKGEVLTVTANFDQALGDLDIRLYKVGKFGAPVAVAATKKAPETFTYTADESTKYYLRVNGFAGDSNVYSLTVCKQMGAPCFECVDDSMCDGLFVCDLKTTKCGPKPCSKPADCEDGNSCTADACNAGKCSNVAQPGIACNDGNACSLGEACDAKASCVAATGTATFALATPVTGTDLGWDSTATDDGGYVLAGTREKSGGGGMRGWLERHDKDGKLVWAKDYLDGEPPCELRGVVAMPGGAEVVAVGACAVPGQAGVTGAWYVRVALSDGGVIASKVTGVGGLAAGLRAVFALDDGIVAAAGYAQDVGTPGNAQDGWLVTLDGDGNVLWPLFVGGAGSDGLSGVVRMAGGTVAAVGHDDTGSGMQGLWVRAGDDGTLIGNGSLDAKVLGGQSQFFAVAAQGGQIVVAGATDVGQAGKDPVAWQAALWRIDAAGKVVSQVVVPATAPQSPGLAGIKTSLAYDLVLRGDGGIVLAGTTGSLADKVGLLDAAIWRLDPNGKVLGLWATGKADKDALRSLTPWGGGWMGYGTQAEGELDSDALWLHVVPPELECDDQNPCTVDTCDAVKGCGFKPAQDGTACGSGKSCAAGICK